MGRTLAAALRHGVAWIGGVFGIVHAVLIGASLSARHHTVERTTTAAPRAWLAAGVLLAGVSTVVAGTFTFQVLMFAGIGPLLLAVGAVLLMVAARHRPAAARPAEVDA